VHANGRLDTVGVAATQTDDLGEYYLGGLPPGDVVVAALRSTTIINVVEGSGLIMPSRSYYPGTGSLLQAQPVVVRAGEQRTNIDFSLSPVSRSTVTVSFLDDRGAPTIANATFSSSIGLVMGSYSIGNAARMSLEPGDWTIFARGLRADLVG